MSTMAAMAFDEARWHAVLARFRLRHAVGGHANDGDMLHATLPFEGEADLVAMFERMGRPLVVLPPDAEVPVAGQRYTVEEYERLRDPIREFPRYERPARTRLFGVSAYVSVGSGEVGIMLSGADGDPYAVTDRDGESALAIERGLRECGLLRD